jgi:hypothetical protein
MAIERTIYGTETLLGVMRELEPVSNFWLNLAFNSEVNFETETIEFEKVTNKRKLAPFVVPMNSGKPIYDLRSEVKSFKPAYIKPKDVVHPTRMIRKQPGELSTEAVMSPQARMNAAVADILKTHRDAIMRRWEWMAAQALLYAEITIAGENYPSTLVQFGRDAGHTVVLTGLNAWNAVNADPVKNLNDWIHTVYRAKFGGAVKDVIIGYEAWDALRQNPEIQEQLAMDVRGTDANFSTGVIGGEEAVFLGMLNRNVRLWLYRDYYEDPTLGVVEYMDPRDVLLIAPGVDGVRAFGAILETDNLRAMSMFPKSWVEEDPSARVLMTQSAPLMIPVNPNCTFRARVVE